MDNKTISIISYLTIIGWLIAFFQYKDNKTPQVKFHLEQSLGIFIFAVLWGIAIRIVLSLMPVLGSLASILSLLPLVLIVIGIINASKELQKPVPVIGEYFVGKFGL